MNVTIFSDPKGDVISAAAAIAAESGAESISIKALTAASGVSNGSIYHHFGSRDGVIAALVLEVFAEYQGGVIEILETNENDAESGVSALVHHHLEWVEANPDRAGLLMVQRDRVASGPQGERLAAQNRDFLGKVGSWLDDQASSGRIPDGSIDLVHALAFAPAQEVCALWLAGRISARPTTFTSRLAPAAWAAISAVPGEGTR